MNPIQHHAQIIPSCIALISTKPVRDGAAILEGMQLLHHPNPSGLTTLRRNMLLDKALKNFHNTMNDVWDAPVALEIHANWGSVLNAEEREAFGHVVKAFNEGRFDPTCDTVRTLKTLMRKSLKIVLATMAKLEASYWSQAHAAQFNKAWVQRHDSGRSFIQVSGIPDGLDASACLQQCLALPWLNEIQCNDLRFGHNGSTPAALLSNIEPGAEIPSGLLHLMHDLLRANSLTVENELRDLIGRVLWSQGRKHSTIEKYVDIFMMRYGGTKGRTLDEVGQKIGLTRERVRQICSVSLCALGAGRAQGQSRPYVLPAMKRALERAGQLAPLHLEQIENELRPLLGKDFGSEALLELAECLNVPTGNLRIARSTVNYGGLRNSIDLVTHDEQDADDWVRVALGIVNQELGALGYVNLRRVLGALFLDHGMSVDQELFMQTVKSLPGFRLLSDSGAWFTASRAEQSGTAVRVRKILVAAGQPVKVDEIAEGLCTSHEWIERTASEGLGFAPLPVLRDLISGLKGIITLQHNRFALAEPLDETTLFNQSELAIVTRLRQLGGVAYRKELADALAMGSEDGQGLSEVGIQAALKRSATLQWFEHGIYVLRGVPISSKALQAARRQRDDVYAKFGTGSIDDVDLNQPVSLNFNFPESTYPIRRQVVYIPALFASTFNGLTLHHKHQREERITIKHGQILGAVAQAAKLGLEGRFGITFDLTEKTYWIHGAIDTAANNQAG